MWAANIPQRGGGDVPCLRACSVECSHQESPSRVQFSCLHFAVVAKSECDERGCRPDSLRFE